MGAYFAPIFAARVVRAASCAVGCVVCVSRALRMGVVLAVRAGLFESGAAAPGGRIGRPPVPCYSITGHGVKCEKNIVHPS